MVKTATDKKIIKNLNKYFYSLILILFISNCTSTENNRYDIDIRSCSRFKTSAAQFDLRIIEFPGKNIGSIIIQGFVCDTIYFYTLRNKYVFFYQEKEKKGVFGSDNFIFSDSGLVYKIRISNDMAPDKKNYISIFKYSDSTCLNLEGKVFYQKIAKVNSIKNFNITNLLSSIVAIDSTVFINSKYKNNFRLTSYLYN